jgi:hypothetical protein
MQEKREREQRAKVRAELEERLDAARDTLSFEQAEKTKLVAAAEKVRQRLTVIARMADVLDNEKQKFEIFAEMKHRTQRPAQLPALKGFFDDVHDCNKPRRQLPPRSSKRTAFTRDHRNRILLGEREDDAKEQQLTRVRSVMELRSRNCSNSVSPAPAALEGDDSQARRGLPSPALSNGSPAGATAAPLRFGLGALSAPDIAGFKNRSCKRSRYYTDHEGKRFLMDSRDMPSISGIVL